jgi:imidazoleglycerol-phosphate dehydratase/histidinol-phosphatase
MTQKILFIDRDGTLIREPADQQVDHVDKVDFMPGVFAALHQLQQAGYVLVMVSNQDGLGTASFPSEHFEAPQALMLKLFASQRIYFSDILICPHLPEAGCACRKPNTGLLMPYIIEQKINRHESYVIGDRDTDGELAARVGLPFLDLRQLHWCEVATTILRKPRQASVTRQTRETDIALTLNLDVNDPCHIETGLPFFNHMLEQIVKHAGIAVTLSAKGDLHIDEHHTVEDVAIVFGKALNQALGDKRGLCRYGFVLPMDEACATVSVDLSGRAALVFNANFPRDEIGGLSCEMVKHFFFSFSQAAQCALHMSVVGENTHHMVESLFKALGRVLRQAIQRDDSNQIASSKGSL